MTEIISRQEALARGLPRFFTGKACNHSHIAERYTRGHGRCVECVCAQDRKRVVRERAAPGFRQFKQHKKDAAVQKLLRYMGKPCRYGHSGERYVNGGMCVECKLSRRAPPDKQRIYRKRSEAKPGVQAKIKATGKRWRDANPESGRAARRKQLEKLQHRLAMALRVRVNMAVTLGSRGGSAVRDLGCSIAEFINYIEARWEPGMTWENRTRDGWHLDHIKPLAHFDLTDRAQFLEVCHYTNYQPLWAIANRSKWHAQKRRNGLI